MLGPVYADNDSVAEVLISYLIKSSNIAQTNGLLFYTRLFSLWFKDCTKIRTRRTR
jgi:hypothetical protein